MSRAAAPALVVSLLAILAVPAHGQTARESHALLVAAVGDQREMEAAEPATDSVAARRAPGAPLRSFRMDQADAPAAPTYEPALLADRDTVLRTALGGMLIGCALGVFMGPDQGSAFGCTVGGVVGAGIGALLGSGL
jgi:hypothetical protein